MIGKQSSNDNVFENSIEKGVGRTLIYFYLSKRQWSVLAENGTLKVSHMLLLFVLSEVQKVFCPSHEFNCLCFVSHGFFSVCFKRRPKGFLLYS